MIQSYLTTTIRNFSRNKFYSTLNILGLGFGITISLLIGLYINDELQFDRFHTNSENIYAVALHAKIGGQEVHTVNTCPPLAAEMKDVIPGVDHAIRIRDWTGVVMKTDDKAFTELNALLADSNFFQFFGFKLISGDPASVLREPNSVVMTPRAATRYFGTDSPIGKLVTAGMDNQTFKITGVAEEPPANSEIQFDILVSSQSDPLMRSGGWTNNSLNTYFRMAPLTTVESVNAKLEEFVTKKTSESLKESLGISYEEFKKKGGIYAYYAYPLSTSHLYQSHIQDGLVPKEDIKYVYIVAAVGSFIIIIASINFMNLSTARSTNRSKEVGLRKTLGSSRSKLITQFLLESFAYTLIAVILAFLATYLLIPAFNSLSGKQLHWGSMISPVFLAGALALLLGIALLSGAYPAFYLTSFDPVEVLKGKVKGGAKSKPVRNGLVMAQFTISIALIISTLVVYDQLNFLQSRDPGMDKQNVIVLRNMRRLGNNIDAFKTQLQSQSGIIEASYTSNLFPGINNMTVFRLTGSQSDQIMCTYFADFDHLNVLKIELANGRYFSRDFPSDTSACVINEAAFRELGLTWTANERLTSFDQGKAEDMNVIGVIKDFNFESLKTKVRPLVIRLTPEANNMLIRYDGLTGSVVTKVEDIWKKSAANEPFEYTFLDQSFDKLFKEERQLGKLFTAMTGIAIFVACLGLLGLASFISEQRTKEIGIRKVLGASVSSINNMLSKELMSLVAVSFIIAAILVWYFMNNWLNTFAFRVELGIGVFFFGGLTAAGIAWFTISFHFIKAARANPVNSLKYE